MPNFQIQNDLTEIHENRENKKTEILDEKIDRLDNILGKFEDMMQGKFSTKERSYQFERAIMSEKIVELSSDLKICQENILDYQNTIQVLCKNHSTLKKHCKRITFENKQLIMKLSTLKETSDQLSYYKMKNKSLVNLIEKLRKETKEFFEKEIEEQEEYKIFIQTTLNQNKNLKHILTGIFEHENTLKIDEIMKSSALKEISDDYGKC